MNLKKMSKDELELLSYNDIAYLILKDTKGSKTTAELFKDVQKTLEFSDEEYIDRIGHFYTTLTTDKRFYSVGKGIWDLKERNVVKVIIDDDDDEIDLDEVSTDEENSEAEDKLDDIDLDDDIEEDDLEEFGIAEEDVLEEDKFEDE